MGDRRSTKGARRARSWPATALTAPPKSPGLQGTAWRLTLIEGLTPRAARARRSTALAIVRHFHSVHSAGWVDRIQLALSGVAARPSGRPIPISFSNPARQTGQ